MGPQGQRNSYQELRVQTQLADWPCSLFKYDLNMIDWETISIRLQHCEEDLFFFICRKSSNCSLNTSKILRNQWFFFPFKTWWSGIIVIQGEGFFPKMCAEKLLFIYFILFYFFCGLTNQLIMYAWVLGGRIQILILVFSCRMTYCIFFVNI